MPDDNSRTQAIEGRIDRGVANAIMPSPAGGAFNLVPKDMGQGMEFAKLMAVSGDCIRQAFRNNPGACLALALQAWRWGADPFAVANKAYITTGKAGSQIAYESQLIHGIVNSSPVLAKRLRHVYDGAGPQRRCTIIGWVRGEDEPLEYTSPTIAQIAVKNSPLWQADPDQQLAYYSTRAWARRHVPEILLGIYTPDEVGETIDVTPVPVQEAHPAEPPPPPMWEVADHTGAIYEFKSASSAVEACRKVLIAAAADPQALATAWENNEALLVELGDGAAPLHRLYAELAPREPRQETEQQPSANDRPERDAADTPADQAGGAPDSRPFATPAIAPANGGGSRDMTDGASASSPAGHGPTATTAASHSEVAPVSDEQRGGTGQGDGEHNASPPPAPTPAASDAPAQTAERHDKFWDASSLKIDPMPVHGGGSLSRKEWKTWPAALLPRIRQAWAIPTLNALYQDNAANLDSYGAACGDRERDELVAAFDAARDRLTPR